MRRNLILLVAAIVVGVVAAIAAAGYLRSARTDIVAENQPVQVLVAQQDLPQGMSAEEMISKEYAKLEEVPDRFVPEDGLSSARPIENMVLAVSVSAGEQLTASRFTFPNEAGLSYTVPEDLVAVSVEVDDVTGVSGLLRPGDSVIVFASFKPEGGMGAARTATLIPKARVLAVGQSLSALAPEGGGEEGGDMLSTRSADAGAYKAVTLALTPQDAARAVFARQNGQLHLALIPQTAPDGAAPKAVLLDSVTE